MMKCFLVMEGDLADMNSIAMVGKERSEKVGITYFGLLYLLTAFIFILLTQRDSSKVVTDGI